MSKGIEYVNDLVLMTANIFQLKCTSVYQNWEACAPSDVRSQKSEARSFSDDNEDACHLVTQVTLPYLTLPYSMGTFKGFQQIGFSLTACDHVI